LEDPFGEPTDQTSVIRRSLRNPLQSVSRSPVEQIRYNFTVAICVIVKDAEAYLEEWIDFHLLGVKFQNIYIYDNSDLFDLKQWYNNTRGHPVYSKVEVIHFPGNGYQKKQDDYIQSIIYSDCVKRFGVDKNGPQHDYLALIDVDEFLVPQKEEYHEVRQILQDYLVPFGGALTVNWMLFGTSNKTLYAPIPLTKRFQYRDNRTHNVIKSIVKSSDFKAMRNPHAVTLKKDAKVHTTKYPGCLHKEAESTDTGASDYDFPSSVMLLHHYRYTSTKEYLQKRCARGNLSIRYIWCNSDDTLRSDTPPHIQPIPGVVFDDRAWQILTSHVPRYRMFEDWPDLS
jgi:hypothetical protein